MNHVGYRIISSDVGTRRRVVGRQAAAEIRFTASVDELGFRNLGFAFSK